MAEVFIMSTDLDFWKYREGAAHNDRKIYETACCDGKISEDLENLPIEEILEKVAAAFPCWKALNSKSYENEDGGAFEIFTTSQIVRFDCYGMKGEDMNRLMDILEEFGCPLYNPQVSTRFDSWTDR